MKPVETSSFSPEVIILDEAGASVNKDAFYGVLQNVVSYRENRIIILISHDPKVWECSDVIYRLEDGELSLEDEH